jgi:hypothetical protein
MGFGPPGFLHAPASKAVMAGVGLASLLVRASWLSPSRVSLTPRAVLGVGAHGRQLISRLVLSNLAFTSVGECLVGLALLYRLARDAERRRGTDRYAAFLVMVVSVATAAQVVATYYAYYTTPNYGVKTNGNVSLFAPGPHALVWAHLPYYVLDVPGLANEPKMTFFGVKWCVASKAPVYVLFISFAFQSEWMFHTGVNDGLFIGDGVMTNTVHRLWSRFAPGLIGVLVSCLTRSKWFPANVERRRNGFPAFGRKRWWPALVRGACAAVFGWLGFLGPVSSRTGAPRVFVAANRPHARPHARVPHGQRGPPRFGFDRDDVGGGFASHRSGDPPPESSVVALTAMGFDEGSVRRALAESGNDLALATESLLEDGAR